MARKTFIIRICRYCGKQFETLDSVKKVCNRTCHKLWYAEWVKENGMGENNPFYGKKHSEQTKEKMSKAKLELVEKGWKPASYKDGKGNQRKYRQVHDRAWRKIRLVVLARDENKCQMPNCNRDAYEVHHIIPHKDNGSGDLENLISLCRKCHWSIYGKEYQYVELFSGIAKSNANGGSPEVGNPVAQPEMEGARD